MAQNSPTVLIRITEDEFPDGQVTIEQFVHNFEFQVGMTDEDLPPALLAAALLLKDADFVWSGNNKPKGDALWEVPGRGRDLRDVTDDERT